MHSSNAGANYTNCVRVQAGLASTLPGNECCSTCNKLEAHSCCSIQLHWRTHRKNTPTQREREREKESERGRGEGSRQSPTASSQSSGPVPWANRYNARRVACLQMCHKMPQLSINCMEIMSVTGLESTGYCRGHAQEGATPTPTGGDGLVLCVEVACQWQRQKNELKSRHRMCA